MDYPKTYMEYLFALNKLKVSKNGISMTKKTLYNEQAKLKGA